MKSKRGYSRLSYLRGLALAALAAAFAAAGCSSGGSNAADIDSDLREESGGGELALVENETEEEPAFGETAEEGGETDASADDESAIEEDNPAGEALAEDEPEFISEESAGDNEPDEAAGESAVKDLPAEDAEPDEELEIKPKLCAPGDRKCYAEGKVMYCSDDGTEWLRSFCGDGSVCSNGECAALICAQGEKSCDGKFALACAGGVRYDVTALCSADETCEDGGCKNVCADAEEVFIGSTVLSSTEKLGSLFEVSSKCWNAVSAEVKYKGPQKVFKIDLLKGVSARFTATSKTRHFDPAVYIMDECSPTAPKCVAGSDVCCAASAETVAFTAPKDGTYFIVVDEWEGIAGAFELSVSEAAPVSASFSMTDATAVYNASTKVATFGATLKNLGLETLPWIEAGLYLDGKRPPVAGVDKPDQILTLYALKPGEARTVSFTYNRPSNGIHTVYVAADPNVRIYQNDMTDDMAGPAEIQIINGLDVSPSELPTQFENRIQTAGEAGYFSFYCAKGEIVSAKVWTFEGSQFLPALAVIGPNRSAAVITKNAAKTEDLPLTVVFKCAEEGEHLFKIAASSLAGTAAQRIGGYSFAAAKLESFAVTPGEVVLFPGRSASLSVTGRWQGGIFPDGPVDPSFLTFKSFNDAGAKVDAAGKITALETAPQGFATIAALDASGGLAPSYCLAQITHIIPGLIYISDERFPRNVPDMGSVSSSIYVPNADAVKQIFAGVSVTHADLSGLKIKLKSPGGAEVTLLNTSSSQKNLATVFGLFEQPDGPGKLEDYAGQNPKGIWTLTIIDTKASNTGRLNNWRLYILHNR